MPDVVRELLWALVATAFVALVRWLCLEGTPKVAKAAGRKLEMWDTLNKIVVCVFLGLLGIAALIASIGYVVSAARSTPDVRPSVIYVDRDGRPLNPQPAVAPEPTIVPAVPNRRPQGSLDSGSGSLGDLKGAKEPAKK